MKRREFFQYIGASSIFLSGCSVKPSINPREEKVDFTNLSPINRHRDFVLENDFFTGDDPHIAHPILWDKEAFFASQKSIPAPSELSEMVIIGGGISGLTMAHEFRHLNPIVLEQATRFGGNAKGESWKGLEYSLGAAYFTKPDEGSRLDLLLKEINAYSVIREKNGNEGVLLKDKIFNQFWQGEGALEKDKTQFLKLHHYLTKINNQDEGYVFPDYPTLDSATVSYVKNLDTKSLYEHFKKVLGEEINPTLLSALEHYCWSSFCGSITEISAAAGLNFLAGEKGTVLVPKAGNSSIAEKLYWNLKNTVTESNLRTQSLVVDLKVDADGVVVSYLDSNQQLKVIKSKVVVCCCPKFIIAKILQEIEPARLKVIQQLKYRSFLVGNVLINKPLKFDIHDLYLAGNGNVNLKKVKVNSLKQKVTDIVFANFADSDNDRSVLSFYRGIPFDQFRADMLDENSYARFYKDFETQALEMGSILGYGKKDIDSIRLTRWGHPLPLAQKGLIASGVLEQTQQPFLDRIYFAEQDNWMLPSLESATQSVFHVSDVIKQKWFC